MTINRANQTWPEDVTADVNTDGKCVAAHLGHVLNCRCHACSNAEPESEMEFERRQRGSASTLAALFIITLFVVCAVAVWPVLSALANVAK